MRGVSESLAGRASYLTFWPMARRDQQGLGRCGLWEELAAAEDARWLDLIDADASGPEGWRALARRGGFSTPAVHVTAAAANAARTPAHADLRGCVTRGVDSRWRSSPSC
ncbi:MAG: hypothetical protein ACREXW_16585 [Gammaproteobacteria bacterium]